MKRRAWAIHSGDQHGILGVFCFSALALAPWHDGLRAALFSTRESARKYLAKVRGPSCKGLFPRAHVVRVKVLIESEAA